LSQYSPHHQCAACLFPQQSFRCTFNSSFLKLNSQQANPALNLAPFGRWTLRDEAAQRRLALR
jgi:hypothetical protein